MNLVVGLIFMTERISYDLEMKTREQNRKNKRTEIERFDWFIERIQTPGFWLVKRTLGCKKFTPEELSRNRFDVILKHDWSIEQCLRHIRVFFGGKTKSPCFVLFNHWLIKQTTNTYRNHFSRTYDNRSNYRVHLFKVKLALIGKNKSQMHLRIT